MALLNNLQFLSPMVIQWCFVDTMVSIYTFLKQLVIYTGLPVSLSKTFRHNTNFWKDLVYRRDPINQISAELNHKNLHVTKHCPVISRVPCFQEIRSLKEPRTVLPGDALMTTCTYDTTNRDVATLGGYDWI